MNLENNISSAASSGCYSRWSEKDGNKYSIGNIESGNVYVAGRGFNESKTDSGVRSVLLNVIKAVSVALIAYILCDHVLNIAAALLVKYIFNIDLTIIPVNGLVVLQDSASYLFMVTMTMIKYAVVFFIFRMTFHMPTSLAHFRTPTVKNKNDIIHSFGMLFITASVLAFIYSAARIFMAVDYVGSNLMNNATVFSKDSGIRWLLLIIWLVLISCLVEVIVHSSAFAALRQFGDWFAIMYMSIISAMILQNFALTPVAFLTTFITGITVVKTESIYAGTIQRIIINVLISVPYAMKVILPPDMWQRCGLLFGLAVFATGFIILGASGFFKKGIAKKYFTLEKKNLFSGGEYVSVYFESLLSIIVFAVCVILFIVGSLVSFNAR